MLKELDKHTFAEAEKGLSVVDFFTPDCPVCSKLGPVLEKTAEERQDLSFFKVNLEDDITLAERFSIDHIPTLILFKNGVPVKSSVGFLSSPQLLAFIED